MTEEEKILQRQLHIINNSFYGKSNINTFKNKIKIDKIMKAYTDIEQSKVLAEILPLESADMCYLPTHIDNEHYFIASLSPYSMCTKMTEVSIEYCTPCWSLAALLDIIKTYSSRLEITFRADKNYNIFAVFGNFVFRSFDECSEGYNNIVDACYEMILKLNELNLL